MNTKLSVNLNKVATLRNTRAIGVPDIVRCARWCIESGADGITVHPRPDQRHIRPHDVDNLAALLKGHLDVEFNVEGNPFLGLLEHATKHRPTQCTLVPDDSEQSTSDHGWDLARDATRLRPIVATLRALGCRISLFVDADATAMPIARDIGADRVELYTEPYARAFAGGRHRDELERLREAASAGRASGLGVNAGHDLNLENLGPLLAAIPYIAEVSIGHALIADALEMGMPEAVRRYRAVANGG